MAYIAPPDDVSSQSWMVILSLDWVGDAPLTMEKLPHFRPFYEDFTYWPRELRLLRVSVEIPPQYTLAGTPPSFVNEPCHPYSRWDDGYEVYRQIKWQKIPEERWWVFREAIKSGGETEIGGKPVKVSSHRVISQYTPFDFVLELKALPCLSRIICKQWHPDLAEFSQGSPFIHEPTLLNHGQRTPNLQGISIGKLMLDVAGLEELWLGEETEQLLFRNKGPGVCAIRAVGNGSGLTLQFIGEYQPHPELPSLWGLRGTRLGGFDMTGLPVVYPSLKELRL